MKLAQKPKSASDTASMIWNIRTGRNQIWEWLVHWIAEHQLYLTGFVAPFFLFEDHFPRWVWIVGWILLTLPWICRLSTYRHLTYLTPVDPLLLGLFVMTLVSFYLSIDQQRSFTFLSQFIIGISTFYGFVNVRYTNMSLWLPIAGLVIVATGLALAAPFIVTWTSSRFFLEQAYNRFTPLTNESLDANILAAILSMTLLVSAAIAWRGQFSSYPVKWHGVFKRLKIAISFAGLLFFLVQLFTQSRGAMIGLAIGLFALLTLYRRKLLLALPVTTIAVYLATKVIDLSNMAHFLLAAGPTSGWTSRQEVWSSAMLMLKSMPFTGIGLGSYPQQIQSLLFPFWGDWKPTHAHNLFLQIGVDLGLPGLVAYTAVLTSCLIMAWRAWRIFRGTEQRNLEALAAGVFASLTAMITHGLVDAPLWNTKPSIVAWFFLGLSAMLYRRSCTDLDGARDDSNPAT